MIRDKKDLDDFVQRMAEGRGKSTAAASSKTKTPRAVSRPTAGVSSNAPPNPVSTDKGAKPTVVKQPKTKIPKPAAATAGAGMGAVTAPTKATKLGLPSVVHNHYYGK
jgi:hypothetical protein